MTDNNTLNLTIEDLTEAGKEKFKAFVGESMYEDILANGVPVFSISTKDPEPSKADHILEQILRSIAKGDKAGAIAINKQTGEIQFLDGADCSDPECLECDDTDCPKHPIKNNNNLDRFN